MICGDHTQSRRTNSFTMKKRVLENYLHEHRECYRHSPFRLIQRANLGCVCIHHRRSPCSGIFQMEGPRELSGLFQISAASSCGISKISICLVCIHTYFMECSRASSWETNQFLPWSPTVPWSFHSHIITSLVPCNDNRDSWLFEMIKNSLRLVPMDLVRRRRGVCPLQRSHWNLIHAHKKKKLRREIFETKCEKNLRM